MSQPLFTPEAFAAKAREVIAEGCVLLRNENAALPLLPGSSIAVFGRTQMNYFKSGLGSGGLVNTRYVTGIYEALERDGDYTLDAQTRKLYEQWIVGHPFEMGDGWANHPWFQQEMPLEDAAVADAAGRCGAALIIIGRTAGEDRDNTSERGSWMLTEGEEAMLEVVCRHFSRTVVLLNTGNIIDMTWVEKYKPSAVMYVWQGGQEGGSGVADVLSGRVNPSGRLTDTIARRIEDYPSDLQFGKEDKCIYTEDIYVGYRYFESFAHDRVLYAFGEGLSYTVFRHEAVSFDGSKDGVSVHHRVVNTGDCFGKEVVQVYFRAPQGQLGKPALVLCGFAKTRLLAPGESEDIEIQIPADRLASYDDSGVTGHRSCFVLEAGEYIFFAGHSVRDLSEAGRFSLEQTAVQAQLEEACAPVEAFERLHPTNGTIAYEPAPLRTVSPAQRRIDNLPEEIAPTGERGLRLEDAAAGRCTVEEFVAQMTDDDLCCIARGEGMSSPRVTPGTAAAFGGVTDRLTDVFGIPAVCCSDGPSGIRMDCGNTAFSMPNGTLQACTWNEELVGELYVFEGLEMRKYQVDNLLGPGMNIHRHPLNGRNFEYFSEDPLVTGRMACAQLKGLDSSGVTGTIKHFACNNQEYRRRFVNAVVSERALREIYLKGFEIAVREGGARSVMTAYNPLNGWWTASHYDLVNTILHRQWGFDGVVMTDWWATGSEDGGEADITNVSSMIRARNDLFMVTGNPSENSGNDNSARSLQDGSATRGEYQRSAVSICRFILDTPAFRRASGQTSDIDRQLQQLRDEEGDTLLSVPQIVVTDEHVIDGSGLDVSGGKSIVYQLSLEKPGRYELSITCRASAALPDTAQLPVSVFANAYHIGSHVLNGGEKEWKTVSQVTPDFRMRLSFYAKFFFAVGGLEVREIRIRHLGSDATAEEDK